MKSIYLKILLLFLVLILSSEIHGQISLEKFDRISIEKGISESIVTCIYQDSHGFMWFGTQNGLNRYDGYKFEIFRNNPMDSTSISGNYIMCIYEDSKGNLWIGTESNGLNLFDRTLHIFRTFKHNNKIKGSISSNSVISIVEDKNKILWIGTKNGLNIFHYKKNKFSKINFTLSNEIVLSGGNIIKHIIEDSHNKLWIGTGCGLISLSPDRKMFKLYINKPDDETSISNNEIHFLHEYINGEIVIATNEGINTYIPSEDSFKRYYYTKDNSDFVKKSEVYSIAEDKKGNLWFGTFGGGLIKWDNQSLETKIYTNSPNNLQSLSNNHVLSLYVDKSGLLWVGTYGGGVNKLNLIKIKFSKIQKEQKQNTLLSEVVNSIIDEENWLIIGTDNGLSLLNKNTNNYFNLSHDDEDKTSLSSNTIYSVFQDSDKNLWIGTSGGGLNWMSAENFRTRKFKFQNFMKSSYYPDFALDKDILCIYEARNGEIWIGTTNGINVINKKGNLLRTYVHNDSDTNSLSNNEVQSIFQDKNGVVWIGTYEGLNKFDIEKQEFIKYYKQQNDTNCLPNNTIYCITEDSKNNIWIGTDEGLCVVDSSREKLTSFSTKNGLPDNVVYGIVEDNDSNMWVSTNNGLCKLIRHYDNKNYSFVKFSTNNWLHCNSFNINAFFKNKKGIIYFGCNKGLTFFDPRDIKRNTYIPPISITDFQLFFKSVLISPDGKTPLSKHISETKKIELRHKENLLYFEFAALSFNQSEKNSYKYFMENLDKDWVYTKNNNATYTYIPPGNYIFRVKASNNEGVWNEESASVEIIIKPPFYQKPIFYIGIVILILLIILLYVNIRTKALIKTRRQLEHKVKERTSELWKANRKLNVTLEDLKTTQAQLVDSEKMASLGQLTAGIAHEINNPINFVSGNIKPLKHDISELYELLKKYDELVKKNKLNQLFDDVKNIKEKINYNFLLEEIDKLLDGIDEGAYRTAEIVRGLRNFSRLDEDELKLADLHKGIEATLLILKNTLKDRIEVVKELNAKSVILCHPGQINQVFMNILSNAYQSIPDKGKIFITTESNNKEISISIQDTGIGMTDEVKKRVFEPFFTTKEVGKGTGLGLSISFGIIEKHHGKIEVYSKINEGTEFIIKIPFTNKSN
ncbi:two-component regulator propeller domain-containing protein [Bacteroidota bacterium]